MFINLDKMLDYLSHDDLGMSMLTFLERLKEKSVQFILLPESTENKLLEAIIRRIVTKVIRL